MSTQTTATDRYVIRNSRGGFVRAYIYESQAQRGAMIRRGWTYAVETPDERGHFLRTVRA
jgi:hypothetical protein